MPPTVYGNDYSSAGGMDLGLQGAADSRYFRSLDSNQNLLRMALSQRQQDIQNQLAAQAQADAQAAREQDHQYRLAAMLQDQANRQYQNQYGAGQDAFRNAMAMAQFKSNQGNTAFDQNLATSKFDWQKSEPSAAEIRDAERKAEMENRNSNNMALSRAMAESMNRLSSEQSAGQNLSTLGDRYKQIGTQFWPAFAGGTVPQQRADIVGEVASTVPFDQSTDVAGMFGKDNLGSTDFNAALQKFIAMNNAKQAAAQAMVNEQGAAGGGGMVGFDSNGRVIPTFVPRQFTPLFPKRSAQPGAPDQPQPAAQAAAEPELDMLKRMLLSGVPYDQAIDHVAKLTLGLTNAPSFSRPTRPY